MFLKLRKRRYFSAVVAFLVVVALAIVLLQLWANLRARSEENILTELGRNCVSVSASKMRLAYTSAGFLQECDADSALDDICRRIVGDAQMPVRGLTIWGVQSEANLEPLASLDGLVSLTFEDSTFSAEQISAINKCSKLRIAVFVNCAFDDLAAKLLSSNLTLKSLTLGGKSLSRILGSINDVPSNLLELALVYGGSENIKLPELSTHSSLRTVRLTAVALSDSEFKKLAGECLNIANPLQQIFVEDVSITDDSIDYLPLLPKLRFLSVKNTEITPAGKKRLEQLLNGRGIKFHIE